jgi:hypothetical protein
MPSNFPFVYRNTYVHDVLDQKKTPLHAWAIARDTHNGERYSRTARVNPACSIFLKTEDKDRTSAQSELHEEKFF